MRDGDTIEIKKVSNGYIVELNALWSNDDKTQKQNEEREYQKVFIGLTAAMVFAEEELRGEDD